MIHTRSIGTLSDITLSLTPALSYGTNNMRHNNTNLMLLQRVVESFQQQRCFNHSKQLLQQLQPDRCQLPTDTATAA